MTKENKIVFGCTGYGPMWAPAANSWLRAVAYASRYLTVESMGALRGIGLTDRMYTHSAENALVQNFLVISDATHIFMTEMDMIIPDDAIIKLLEIDKPIASGIYFLRGGNGQPCLYRKSLTFKGNEHAMTPVTIFPTDQPFKLTGNPGLGCVLIKREVFENGIVTYPWFDLKEKAYGSDMFFYSNMVKAGIEIWAHPGVMCEQIDYTVVSVSDYHERIKNDRAFADSGYIIGTAEQDLSAAPK